MTDPTVAFSDPTSVSGYAERTMRLVPGLRDLHRLIGILIAERVPPDARVLVLGAGGGLELRALAGMQSGWRFDGVDPSREMLELARTALGEHQARVTLHEGYIDTAPSGPFDAATCLLTLHFLDKAERQRTVREVFRRLKPAAPFVTAHHSFPREESDKWLRRNAAFAASSAVSAAQTEDSIRMMKKRLPALSPKEDEDILRECGFSSVELFYAAFTFKGWVAYTPDRS